MTTTTTTSSRKMPPQQPPCWFLFLVGLALLSLAVPPTHAFSRSPPPQSPYDRRPPLIPPTSDDESVLEDRGASTRPLHPMLGPGSRVAVAGAEVPGYNTLARLVTMKLFKNQHRPYLLVPSLDKTPTGLGFDQYRGLTRYICTAPKDRAKEGEGKFPQGIDGLVMCSERGYSAKDVKEMLARVEEPEEEGKGLKRVVMLSNLGVDRRDDFMFKIRQFGVNLDERHAAEQELIEQATKRGFSYTLIRVGKLRGGGGEQGLGYEFYDQNSNPIEAKMEESFDETRRGFTFSYCDNIQGETGRILASETIIKALGSGHVEDVAIALVSEEGKTWPNFQVAPWDLF